MARDHFNIFHLPYYAVNTVRLRRGSEVCKGGWVRSWGVERC